MKTKITLFALSALVITASNHGSINQVVDLHRGPASEEKAEPAKTGFRFLQRQPLNTQHTDFIESTSPKTLKQVLRLSTH